MMMTTCVTYPKRQLISGIFNMKIYSEHAGNDLYLKRKVTKGEVKATISIEDTLNNGSEMKIELTKKQIIMLANDLLAISRR